MFSSHLLEDSIEIKDVHSHQEQVVLSSPVADRAFGNAPHRHAEPITDPGNSICKELVIWLEINNENPVWWAPCKGEAKDAEGAQRGDT